MPDHPQPPQREVMSWDDPEMEEERLAFARRQERHRRPVTYPPKNPAPHDQTTGLLKIRPPQWMTGDDRVEDEAGE
jgi:hypothetical protein